MLKNKKGPHCTSGGGFLASDFTDFHGLSELLILYGLTQTFFRFFLVVITFLCIFAPY